MTTWSPGRSSARSAQSVAAIPELNARAVGGLLDRRQRRLERRAGRVAGAGVLESAAQAADAVLGERRTGVDRRVDGAGGRVGPVTGVDGPGRRTVGAVVVGL